MDDFFQIIASSRGVDVSRVDREETLQQILRLGSWYAVIRNDQNLKETVLVEDIRTDLLKVLWQYDPSILDRERVQGFMTFHEDQIPVDMTLGSLQRMVKMLIRELLVLFPVQTRRDFEMFYPDLVDRPRLKTWRSLIPENVFGFVEQSVHTIIRGAPRPNLQLEPVLLPVERFYTAEQLINIFIYLSLQWLDTITELPCVFYMCFHVFLAFSELLDEETPIQTVAIILLKNFLKKFLQEDFYRHEMLLHSGDQQPKCPEFTDIHDLATALNEPTGIPRVLRQFAKEHRLPIELVLQVQLQPNILHMRIMFLTGQIYQLLNRHSGRTVVDYQKLVIFLNNIFGAVLREDLNFITVNKIVKDPKIHEYAKYILKSEECERFLEEMLGK